MREKEENEQKERNVAKFSIYPILMKQHFLGGYSGKDTIMWFLKNCHLSFPGGFLHGLNDLTFGVDMVQIRWMGILQVFF
jgi:hypothetical protein